MATSEQIIQSGDRLYLVEWWESENKHPIIIRATSECGELIDCQDHPGIKTALLQIINLTPAGKSTRAHQQTRNTHEKRND